MIMRKTLAVLLAAIVLMGTPIVGIAQAPSSTLRGQVVDAGGRGASAVRVELVRDNMVVSTIMSSTDGHFSFPGVPAGNYIVRTMVNGQPTGVRATVTAGETPATALLVLPSLATASPQLGAAFGSILSSALSVATSAVTSALVVVAAENGDVEYLYVTLDQSLNALITLITAVPTAPGAPPAFGNIPIVPVAPPPTNFVPPVINLPPGGVPPGVIIILPPSAIPPGVLPPGFGSASGTR